MAVISAIFDALQYRYNGMTYSFDLALIDQNGNIVTRGSVVSVGVVNNQIVAKYVFNPPQGSTNIPAGTYRIVSTVINNFNVPSGELEITLQAPAKRIEVEEYAPASTQVSNTIRFEVGEGQMPTDGRKEVALLHVDRYITTFTGFGIVRQTTGLRFFVVSKILDPSGLVSSDTALVAGTSAQIDFGGGLVKSFYFRVLIDVTGNGEITLVQLGLSPA